MLFCSAVYWASHQPRDSRSSSTRPIFLVSGVPFCPAFHIAWSRIVRWIFTFLLVLPLSVSAGFFKCKDADGNTVYSDTACNNSERSQIHVDTSAPRYTSQRNVSTPVAGGAGARERADYEKKRAKLERELSSIQVGTNQTFGRMTQNADRRRQLKAEIKRLDRAYLIKTNPSAAQQMMDDDKVEALERKVKRLERERRKANAPVIYTRSGNSVYGSNGEVWRRDGNTIYGPGGKTCFDYGNTITCP